MDEVQAPESYVAYPRASAGRLDTAARLQALSEGFFGLYYVVLLSGFLLVLLIHFGEQLDSLVLFAFMATIVNLASYPFLRKIGYGLSWSRSYSVIASGIVGLCSILCFGTVGVWIYQSMAADEMVRLGVKRHFFGGVRKSEIDARIAELVTTPGPLLRAISTTDSASQ